MPRNVIIFLPAGSPPDAFRCDDCLHWGSAIVGDPAASPFVVACVSPPPSAAPDESLAASTVPRSPPLDETGRAAESYAERLMLAAECLLFDPGCERLNAEALTLQAIGSFDVYLARATFFSDASRRMVALWIGVSDVPAGAVCVRDPRGLHERASKARAARGTPPAPGDESSRATGPPSPRTTAR